MKASLVLGFRGPSKFQYFELKNHNDPLQAEEALHALGPSEAWTKAIVLLWGDFSCDAPTAGPPLPPYCNPGGLSNGGGGHVQGGQAGGLHGGVGKVTNLASQRHGTSKGV